MDNHKLPAYPFTIREGYGDEGMIKETTFHGFTKLELASLMIAQGLVGKYSLNAPSDQKIIARLSVELAAEVLEEANK